MEDIDPLTLFTTNHWNSTGLFISGNISDFQQPTRWTSITEINFENTTAMEIKVNSSERMNRTTANSAVSVFYPIIVAEMVLSIICLVLSIVVYSILPEFQNVHGKNLISLSSCLLTTFVLLCVDIKLRLVVPYSVCFVIAVFTHVTFLATFFWTNVMTFDIWSNITSIRSKQGVKSGSKRYLRYSVYAWTATALAALPAFLIELTDIVPKDFRPHFGVRRCWLSGRTAFVLYFNLPVGMVLLGNLVMFVLTIWRLWRIKKMTEILHVKQQQKRLNLYLKLFFVMGIVWFTEFLPWATKVYQLYALAGMMTALQGVLLFAIFVLKKRILRQIRDLLTGKVSIKKLSTSCSPSSSNSGQQLTSSSQNGSKA